MGTFFFVNKYKEILEKNMKLFNAFVFLGAASAMDPAADLQTMLAEASIRVNDVLGEETFNDKWRVKGRKILNKLANRMIADFENRRDNHGCDPNVMRSLAEAQEVDDDIEKALPEKCLVIGKPIRDLSRDAR